MLSREDEQYDMPDVRRGAPIAEPELTDVSIQASSVALDDTDGSLARASSAARDEPDVYVHLGPERVFRQVRDVLFRRPLSAFGHNVRRLWNDPTDTARRPNENPRQHSEDGNRRTEATDMERDEKAKASWWRRQGRRCPRSDHVRRLWRNYCPPFRVAGDNSSSVVVEPESECSEDEVASGRLRAFNRV